MLSPTTSQLFGVNFTQTTNTLTISKSDLVNIGLTPNINNRGEQLLAAIVLKALSQMSDILTTEGNIVLNDEKNLLLSFDNSNLFTELSLMQWETRFISKQQATYRKDTIVIKQYEVV